MTNYSETRNSHQIKVGSLLSYIQMGCAVLVMLIYTPFLIRALGKSEYGLYNTVSSTISLLSILSLGFNASYIRFYSKYKNDDDHTKENRLNGLFLLLFIGIGIVALLCGIFITFNLNFIFDSGLTNEEYEIAKILSLLFTIHLSLSFPMSVFQNIITAHERFIVLKSLGLFRTIATPLATIPFLLHGGGSIPIVVVTIVVATIIDCVYIVFVLFKLRCRFWVGHIENGVFKNLIFYTSFIAINIVIDQINWNVDKVLLGRFIGASSVAVYSVGYTIYQFYQTISSSLSGMFTPRIHNISVKYENDNEKRFGLYTELFIKVGRIQFLILSLICSGFIFFGQLFISLWAGDGYEQSYYVSLLLMIPASIPLIQNLGIEIQRAENLHKFRSFVYLGMAIINLVASIFLCKLYGPIGCALGTAISLLVANGLIMNIYYYKKCGLDIPQYWKNIFKMSLGLLPPVGFGIITSFVWKADSFLLMLLQIVIYSVIFSLSMWFIGMNSFEKQLISKPILSLFKKRGQKNDN